MPRTLAPAPWLLMQADFSFFFDTGGRRKCYIAPERFYDAAGAGKAQEAAGSQLTPAMVGGWAGGCGGAGVGSRDVRLPECMWWAGPCLRLPHCADPARRVVSAGRVFRRLRAGRAFHGWAAAVQLLQGALSPLWPGMHFSSCCFHDRAVPVHHMHPAWGVAGWQAPTEPASFIALCPGPSPGLQLLAYRQGGYDPAPALERLEPGVREVVLAMIRRDPAGRPPAAECLQVGPIWLRNLLHLGRRATLASSMY